jgi:hypothetical protein
MLGEIGRLYDVVFIETTQVKKIASGTAVNYSSIIGAVSDQTGVPVKANTGPGQGGNPAGTYYYGGLVKFNTSSSTATSLWADVTATSRAQTSGAENGTTAAYLGGGNMMPYITFPTNILKVVYATDSTYSTLSATLSTARAPARVGVQAGVCAYFAGGRASSGSNAPLLTTVEKLTYSTETRSMVSTASVSRTGLSSWNT